MANEQAFADQLLTTLWQPIETAPRDGTSIIGAYFGQPWSESHREGRIAQCWFQPEFEAFISKCNRHTLRSGYTFEDGTSSRLHSPEVEDVTHWMPLPPPPIARLEGSCLRAAE